MQQQSRNQEQDAHQEDGLIDGSDRIPEDRQGPSSPKELPLEQLGN